MKPNHIVLMMAYGGPDSLDDVEPYLLDVRGGRATSPELIHEIKERYAAIGGKSPLLEMTLRQAQALETCLNRSCVSEYQVLIGMRHWKPYIRETVDQIVKNGVNKITAICMTPFSSKMSTGAYYDHLTQAISTHSSESLWYSNLELRKIGAWYSHKGFIRSIANHLDQKLAELRRSSTDYVVFFSAHSLPAALAQQGDPYATQFFDLCRLVAKELHLLESQWRSCFQSAGAQNLKWLGPSLNEMIDWAASEGKESLLVAPIGFLCDHVEILYDVDIEAQNRAAELGVKLIRMESLNDDPIFINALADIILDRGNHI